MKARTVREGSFWPGILLSAPLVVFLSALFLYPMAHLCRIAFQDGLPAVDRVTLLALKNSVVLSLAVATLSLIICFIPAWVLARWTFRGKLILRSALTLPLTFSGVVVGFLAILMMGRVGILPTLAVKLFGYPAMSGMAYGGTGLLLAYLYFEIPRATLALEAAFLDIDPALEAAAATLGAGPLARMTRVVLPVTRPALISTFLLTFAVSLGSYGVAMLLTRRTVYLPVEIYTAFTGFLDDQRAAFLSMILVLIALGAAAAGRLLRRGD